MQRFKTHNNLGWIYIGTGDEEDEEMFSDFIKNYDPELGWGFKRPERLDVKKPGPYYKTNNYAFVVSYSQTLNINILNSE